MADNKDQVSPCWLLRGQSAAAEEPTGQAALSSQPHAQISCSHPALSQSCFLLWAPAAATDVMEVKMRTAADCQSGDFAAASIGRLILAQSDNFNLLTELC